MCVVALVTDLLFATKIRSTAEAVGVAVQLARSMPELLRAAERANLVLIDVNSSGLDAIEAIRQVRSLPNRPKILAYLSHVQRELADAAGHAGADEVMPRSRFSSELPAILQHAPTEPPRM